VGPDFDDLAQLHVHVGVWVLVNPRYDVGPGISPHGSLDALARRLGRRRGLAWDGGADQSGR
jgi:hypothetical protein